MPNISLFVLALFIMVVQATLSCGRSNRDIKPRRFDLATCACATYNTGKININNINIYI